MSQNILICSLVILFVKFSICLYQNTIVDISIKNKIIGGETITVKEIPYQVSIQYNGSHICGGVLITLEHVLTAAQCIHRENESGKYELIPTSEIVIKAGNDWLNDTMENVQYSNGYNLSFHIGYDPNSLINYDNDIAVIKVSPVFNVTPTVSTASLRWAPSAAGEMCMVVGWGTTQENGSLSQQLNKVDVPIFDYDECKTIYGDILSNQMICAGYIEGQKDSCWGDTGGPLVCERGVVAGIVSFKPNCGQPNYPGVYTEINPHVLWINQALATT